jgi:hypothetical protein
MHCSAIHRSIGRHDEEKMSDAKIARLGRCFGNRKLGGRYL